MNFMIINLCVYIVMTTAELQRIDVSNGTGHLGPTRRILNGQNISDTRPYMVYLRPASNADPKAKDTNWLCAGVIIHAQYILTSAACIEDVKQFYVVSGTHRWVSPSVKNDDCIKYGSKKAIWKCVPKSYVYDGDEFGNIRWMIGDIAVVKVDEKFNFERRVRGCDFIPKMIAFNNQSDDFEKAGTLASIAGWGSSEKFGELISRTTVNSPILQEAELVIISNGNCKRRWDQRYHFIIDGNMICTKDNTDGDAMSAACLDEVKCKELQYSYEDAVVDETMVRRVLDPAEFMVHGSGHTDGRRNAKTPTGGFCENDHGGPLVYGQGQSAMVIGVMSACQTRDLTKKCYGPFLYTSVYKNRFLINCAITKDFGPSQSMCRRMLESTKTQMIETNFNWTTHTDGPAKSGMADEDSVSTTPLDIDNTPDMDKMDITTEGTITNYDE